MRAPRALREPRLEDRPDQAEAGASHADGRVPCPECGRRFQRRGLAAHRRQAHGQRPAPPPSPTARLEEPIAALSALVADVTAHLTRLDQRIGRIEAALVGDAERRSRARDVPSDLDELQAELDEVLAEIKDLVEALGTDLGTEVAAPSEAHQPLRGRLGALRQRQAAILFRMGPSAPGGAFPPGDTALLQR